MLVAEDDLYIMEDDSSVMVIRDESSRADYPGSTLMSPDGVHPNGAGYEAWGIIIAQAILDEWKHQ